MPKDEKPRKRMVVEEVGAPAAAVSAEPIEPARNASSIADAGGEIKEKVEELQTITDDIAESVEKSADVQEEIAKAAEEALPVESKESKPMPQVEPEQVSPQIKNSSGPNPLIIIIPGIFLLGALLGGIVFYQRGIGETTGTPTPNPTTFDNLIASPSPTPQTTLDLTKYPINVMNGSGIAGQAGVVKDLLTAGGFTVSGTGNAASYDFTKTVIKAKVDVPAAFLTQLTTSLSKKYVLDTNQSLATSSAHEVEVIVGSTKAQ